ncbi:MAG: hypothetical protein PHV68_07235 [Candidatus Gastranaerophilales bacterium]|nr:hypothetical protein [Candidatus Gastranaerophilales bacterium]
MHVYARKPFLERKHLLGQKLKMLALAFLILFVLILNCSYTFPDKELNWQDIRSFKTEKIKLKNTDLYDFHAKYCPDAPIIKINKNVSIINLDPLNISEFNLVRVGFKNNVLDWVQFSLNKLVKMEDFIKIYGKPIEINSNYNAVSDFYNYGFFNVSTDKNHIFAQTISIFEEWQPHVANTPLDYNLPKFDEFNKVKLLKIGATLQEDFTKLYPDLKPLIEGKNTNEVIYLLNNELITSKLVYEKAILTFKNGCLFSIKLYPKGLYLENIVELYGSPLKYEQINSQYVFYEYEKFICVVDLKENKVINVGIVGTN